MEAPKIMANIYFAEMDNALHHFMFMAIFGFAHTLTMQFISLKRCTFGFP